MSTKRRRGNGEKGLSDTVTYITIDDDDVHYEDHGSGQSEYDRWNEARARLRQLWEAITYQRKDLFNASGLGSFSDIPFHDQDAADDDDWNDLDLLVPGEEGAFHSNAGGEFSQEGFLNTLLSEAPSRIDMRDRHFRTEDQTEAWKRRMPRLVDAYLEYKARGAPGGDELEGEAWDILTMDFVDADSHPGFRHVSGAEFTNETLARHGFLGGSPEHPTIAFPFHFLESFRQIHRVCPRFSLNGLSRVLTNTHGRFPMPTLEDQLRVAYDAYLVIQREVQARVDTALSRDPHQHFIGQICPPCMNELENETPLDPTMLIAMDANFSLKRVDSEKRYGTPRLDTREIKHPRWLDPEIVDLYKDEVANAQRGKEQPVVTTCEGSTIPPDSSTDVAYLNQEEMEELEQCVDTCVERWKAAGPDANKKMFSFYATSGIFLAVCRHGHALVICDMRRSGELMKYPLAVVKTLLDRYGKALGLGYDIMCAFYATLMRSQKLKNQVVASRLRGVVPAFHGHAHNRKCQVNWHPMYINGVGLEDFEECERTFSESNHLAATTRLATEFHRHQSILEHFEFHDQDKHVTSGNFIYQNYRQALHRIATDGPLFKELCEEWGVTEDDCERFLEEEREHFSKEYEDPPEIAAKLDYVELLQKLARHDRLAKEADQRYQAASTDRKVAPDKVRSLFAVARTSLERYKDTLEEVRVFETEHDHYQRWKTTDKNYQETLAAMRGRTYRRALEKLERLVVQRLLELTKLNVSGLGYKQREKITQALRARAKAIQNALDAYNEAAVIMDPPRPILQWRDVLDMATLADFDLLKATHLDLTNVAWAQANNRECMRLHFGLKRAREEIGRLNVEISRLLTFMIDEHADYHHAIAQAHDAGQLDLAAELERRRCVSVEINGHIAIRLVQTSELEGFTGTLVPGRRKGRDPHITDSAPLAPWAPIVLGLTRTEQGYQSSTPQDVSHILPVLSEDTLPTAALLDVFERLSMSQPRPNDDPHL
ncbi:hypothetical protein V5O48_015664 [Marasmius crinis-equi]|uniref:CxC2-like cysteine cluster KDZ transposase-associated domain-containing protein n=1 Tax=Marasmius crinis-equi TaxID=585013 RepID=A0ABR3ETY9_9AGAR